MITVAITFDRHAPAFALDNQIDPECPDAPLRQHAISRRQKPLHHLAFERRLRPIFLLFQRPHQVARVLGVFDQLPPQIVGLQIILRAQRMHHPHLVARAACGHVKPLLEQFLVAQ